MNIKDIPHTSSEPPLAIRMHQMLESRWQMFCSNFLLLPAISLISGAEITQLEEAVNYHSIYPQNCRLKYLVSTHRPSIERWPIPLTYYSHLPLSSTTLTYHSHQPISPTSLTNHSHGVSPTPTTLTYYPHLLYYNGITIERQELKDCYRTSRYQLERALTGRLVSDFIHCEGGCDECSYCGIEEGCLLDFTHP